MCGHTKRDMIRNQEIVRACEVEKHKCPVRRCETLAMVGMRIGRGRPKKQCQRGDQIGYDTRVTYCINDLRQEGMEVEDQGKRLICSRTLTSFPYQYCSNYYFSAILFFVLLPPVASSTSVTVFFVIATALFYFIFTVASLLLCFLSILLIIMLYLSLRVYRKQPLYLHNIGARLRTHYHSQIPLV